MFFTFQAYVGFVGSDVNKDNLSAIATGNWGCGAFHGNPKLKVLIQLIAAAVAGRSMVYFTFGDTNLRDEVATMYTHLVQHDIDIGKHAKYRRCKVTENFDCFVYYNTCI